MGHHILKYNHITLNGISRQGKELVTFCKLELNKTSTPEWLIHIYTFILEWLSSDDYVLAHTSGSTGKPKEIKLLKKQMIASAHKTVNYFDLNKNKTTLLCLSANYIAGKMMLVRAFVGGFNLILSEPTGNPLKNLSHSIDFAAMVPLQVFNSVPDFNNRVKTVIVGGGAVSLALKNQMLKLHTQFYETYGMTETVSHVAIRRVQEQDAYFKAMPDVKFALDDRGCLKIIASDVCKNDLITNDIVLLKGTTEFQFLGRYDHVINTGGVKIIPEEVEAKLSGLLDIPFVISSVPDIKLGEKVVLVIEKEEVPKNLDFQCLNKYEVPRQIIAVPEFPLTDTGKIKRVEVKKLIQDV